ncbi:MAG: DNA alkylation repair protein [Maribacter sp.]
MISSEMNAYLETLRSEFEANADTNIAMQQKAYLKGLFSCYGMKTPLRRKVQQPFLEQEHLPPKETMEHLVRVLWNLPEREYHYFAQELALKYKKYLALEDISLFEFMITHNSWWDTVDFIATKLIKAYFHKFPEQRNVYIKKWLSSGNIWLQRSCLLFQLLEKEKTDVPLLKRIITSLLGSKEFFINKAIGWALRDYSRTDPDWVSHFVETHGLHPLSRREALKLIT